MTRAGPKLEPRSTSFLKWEVIVNDPIGATINLLVLSFLTPSITMSRSEAVFELAWRTLVGGGMAAALGLVVPYGIRWLFRRDLAPEFLKTPILLAGALGVYAAGEAVQPETGLVGATLFGVVLANIDVTGLQELRRFKEALTVFLVSGLFILLTANIDRQTVLMLNWPIATTTLFILFVVRPLAIWLSTIEVLSVIGEEPRARPAAAARRRLTRQGARLDRILRSPCRAVGRSVPHNLEGWPCASFPPRPPPPASRRRSWLPFRAAHAIIMATRSTGLSRERASPPSGRRAREGDGLPPHRGRHGSAPLEVGEAAESIVAVALAPGSRPRELVAWKCRSAQ